MKKIILIICVLFSVNMVKAESLEYELLPYYAKISKYNDSERVVQLKKVYDKETLEVVFNADPKKYDVGGTYLKTDEVNMDNFGRFYRDLYQFQTIIYYLYENNQTDLNYYFTQLIIWSRVCGYNVKIVDEDGNEITDYAKDYNTAWNNQGTNHFLAIPYSNKRYTINLWETLNITYSYNNVILDNPTVDGVDITTVARDLYISASKAGEYTLEFSKEYEHEDYSYINDDGTFWRHVGGPSNKYDKLYLMVLGIELTIKENVIGVNNRVGDAKLLKSNYEIYYENKLVELINVNDNVMVTPNSDYLIKDVSTNVGFNNSDDILVSLNDNNYELVIDKYVVSKNISLDILDDYTYNIYLKSNNELYETIDKDTDLITLPYGTYYINSNDCDYFYEFEVFDNIDILLTIDNSVSDFDNDILDDVKSDDDNKLIEDEELSDNELEENEKLNDNENNTGNDIILVEDDINNNIDDKLGALIEEENNNNVLEDNIFYEEENPQTGDNISSYYSIALLGSVFTVVLLRKLLFKD